MFRYLQKVTVAKCWDLTALVLAKCPGLSTPMEYTPCASPKYPSAAAGAAGTSWSAAASYGSVKHARPQPNWRRENLQHAESSANPPRSSKILLASGGAVMDKCPFGGTPGKLQPCEHLQRRTSSHTSCTPGTSRPCCSGGPGCSPRSTDPAA